MPAIASTRVVLSARQPTLGSGNERRRPTIGCCIAARSRIADGASLQTTTIARLPTRRVTDGARCLAGLEKLFQLADGGGFSPIVPLVSVLGGFTIARAVVYWRAEALFTSCYFVQYPIARHAYAEKCATHSSTVTPSSRSTSQPEDFAPGAGPRRGDARGVHGDEAELGGWAAVPREAAPKSLQNVGRCGGDGVGLRGLRGRRSRGHHALSTSFSIVI